MHKNQQPVIQEPELSKDLLRLYDEFTEFQDRCSFLCDAFACILARHEYVDENTINGFSYYAHWLKQQVVGFKERLKHMHECSCGRSDLGNP